MRLFLESVKAQSAIEYLMTYGWMLLVVAIVGGAVFSLTSDQSIESVSGFASSEIAVDDFGMTTSGLAISLQGRSAENTVIEEVFISSSNGANATVPLRTEIGLGEQKSLNLPYVTSSDEVDNVNIRITYSSGGLSNITASGAVTGQLEFDESLVGYWPLSRIQGNQSHVYDISQNQNHGQINGSKYVDTEIGTAMQFDGADDKIELSGDRGSGRTNDITASVWAKTSKGGWIFGEGTVFRMYMAPEGVARFWIRDEGLGESNSVGGGNIEEDTWYHLAGVYDSSTGEQTLYINGEQAAEESLDFQGIGNNHDNLCLGESWCGSGGFFNGTISDVRIFNRALSEREIQGMYNNPELIQ